jgi:GT2 family glycosyltransferase
MGKRLKNCQFWAKVDGRVANPELSVVILAYNVRQLLEDCLDSVFKNKKKNDNWEVIVVDNDSKDGTVAAVRKNYPQVKVITSDRNLGFAAGNNLARQLFERADYVLFLNPDTVVLDGAIKKSMQFMKEHPKAGALTCRADLPNGKMDYSCKRGLPTLWNSFAYFSGLAKLFPESPVFAGYSATYLPDDQINEIECGSGTFFMIRQRAGRQVGWWDTDYFWNGEDVEFCYRLREAGWKIYFYPEARIIHYKGSSSGLWSTAKIKVSRETKILAAQSATRAMRIFYSKHYAPKLPWFLRWFIFLGINLLEKMRLIKINLGLKYE